MLTSNEAESVFSKEDSKQCEALVQRCAERSATSNLINDLVARKTKKPNKQFQGSRTPIPRFDELTTEEAVRKLLPAGGRIRCDRFNGRWQMFYKRPDAVGGGVWRSKSRSWGSRSHEECLKELLSWVWALAQSFGEECRWSGLSESPMCPTGYRMAEASSATSSSSK